MKNKKRVLVGMSGGIDSSVTAALLQKRGYDVIGITMQLVPKETEKQSACCNIGAINDAKRVASKLNIPHYTINIRDDFKHYVIDNFVNEYLLGHTPNPCVECNRYIKFDALEQKCKELNADFIATGHYCKITSNATKSRFFLKKAKDEKKDQSYFLYMLSQEQLKRTLFPLGHYLKSEIRDMAHSLNLINANKKESQDICFVTKGNYQSFIETMIDKQTVKPGNIMDTDGKILGKHTGIYHYTIGQRKGLNISHNEPLYVIKLNAKENNVIVGTKDELATNIFSIHTYSIVNPDQINTNKVYSVKVRYQMVPFQCKLLHINKKEIMLKATTPLQFITPGQSCVIYNNDTVIGGGIITK
ncbi:tRNA 2-thiouridine(34) synthase MnmA [bacterium]|mgnify:CR=1 FL=1|nr:tRNA 2-thiouridine(34) synthase MnmA [bacterium]|tara:strand:- start:308 stop:1384 length:1077 start_codon:yes stop_codon:yes gene_type:complete